MNVQKLVGLALVSSLVACGGGGEGRARNPEGARGNAQQGPAVPGAGAERRDDARDKRVEAATGWDKLGERMVDGKADRDVIAVGKADGRFSAIQIKVEQSALELFDVVVTFGDGSTFAPPTRLVFKNGETSRVIDLPGDKRTIKKVEFKYANLPGGGRAQVELWGKP
jgi:hypothetical protein